MPHVLATAYAVLAAAALLTLWRVVRGPTLPDRVVAIDLLGVIVTGFVVVSAASTGATWFLDIAIVIALISFVGTIAYARYIEAAKRT
ncbi:MAG TPA: monovalent cation/H+ antiporter complex subunit F [Longimicrobium sp.]|nr:monovalent cation/H+ antiporter complex subunit F [Longimicrobium sp.]